MPKTELKDHTPGTGQREITSKENRLAFCRDETYFKWDVNAFKDEDNNHKTTGFFDLKTSQNLPKMVAVSDTAFEYHKDGKVCPSIAPGRMWAMKPTKEGEKKDKDDSYTLVCGPSHNIDQHVKQNGDLSATAATRFPVSDGEQPHRITSYDPTQAAEEKGKHLTHYDLNTQQTEVIVNGVPRAKDEYEVVPDAAIANACLVRLKPGEAAYDGLEPGVVGRLESGDRVFLPSGKQTSCDFPKDKLEEVLQIQLLQISIPSQTADEEPLQDMLANFAMLQNDHGIKVEDLRKPLFMDKIDFLNTMLESCGVHKGGDRLRMINHVVECKDVQLSTECDCGYLAFKIERREAKKVTAKEALARKEAKQKAM